MTTQLAFHDHQFSVTNHNNQIYLTVTQIGLALNYANPETAITKIFNRHKDEFTDQMSTLVKLTTSSGAQESRIFSLRGAHLIAMFARTPIAKEFRRWVLNILDREVGGSIIQPAAPTEEMITLTIPRSELCSLCWGWSAGEYMREGLEQVSPGLIALRSPLADSIETMASHYKRTLEAVRVILERETRNIEPHPYAIEDANWRTVLQRVRNRAI
ncbi:hypothetical protein I7V28_01385 [Lelliottia amnigena]|uniref:BRO family protein n=1 Tax=Lelliottia amnigena TaxID=61646 RepID=UPI00192B47D3|nr:BRO family protein [Lelliottia amnigena]MBL5919787.1 hypothetical protein [Lelliottia amnigena]